MFSVENQTVLVTGGTRGIGKGIAQAFLKSGADVFICARNEPEVAIHAPGDPSRAAAFKLTLTPLVGTPSLRNRMKLLFG